MIKYVICKIRPSGNSYSKLIGVQHITRVTSDCSHRKLVSAVSSAAKGLVYAASSGASVGASWLAF